jgi:hypothetical protein
MHEFNHQAGFPGVSVHLMQCISFMKSAAYGFEKASSWCKAYNGYQSI